MQGEHSRQKGQIAARTGVAVEVAHSAERQRAAADAERLMRANQFLLFLESPTHAMHHIKLSQKPQAKLKLILRVT